MNNPDWNQVYLDQNIWKAEHDTIILQPRGYLIAVVIEPIAEMPAPKPNIDDEEYSLHWRAMYNFGHTDFKTGVFDFIRDIRWEYPVSMCGIGFEKPIPDVNTAHPFAIMSIHPIKRVDVKVTTVHLGIR